jgi:autotransporter-associated beta strand protein
MIGGLGGVIDTNGNTLIISGPVVGGSPLTKAGVGTLALTGANPSFSGTLNVEAGTVSAGAPTALGFSAVIVGTAGTVALNGFNHTLRSLAGNGAVTLGAAALTVGIDNSSSEFFGVISGTGSLTKAGTGTLTLAGNNTYTGTTTVDGGTLLVNGSIVSPVTVNAGGTLGGNGQHGHVTLNGGTLAPGNSIGTITMQGNLTFGPGSVYAAEVHQTVVDRTNVAGAAALAGTVQATALGGSFQTRTYTILNAAGGVTGTFDNIVGTDLTTAMRNPRLSYDANNVFMTLDRSVLTHQLPVGARANPRAVAAAIDNVVAAGVTPPPTWEPLAALSGAALSGALTQLSGEVATGVQQAGVRAVDLFLGVMLNPFLHGRGEAQAPALAFAPERQALPQDAAAAYAAVLKAPATPVNFERRWSVWGSAFGGTSNIDGDTGVGSSNQRADAYGFAAGVDHRVSPDTIVGFALGGGGTSWSLANGLGTGKSDMFQAGIYGSHRFAGAAYVSAALAYTWHGASTSRTLTSLAGGQLNADFDVNSAGGRIEGGYRWATPFAGFTPYGAVQAITTSAPAYAETGSVAAAPFALSIGSRDVTSTRSEIGLWFDRSSAVGSDMALTLRARAAWAHDFDTDRHITATFQTLPLSSFTVAGASPAQDYALLSGAAELRLRNGWSVSVKGDTELASRTQIYSGTGVVRYAW